MIIPKIHLRLELRFIKYTYFIFSLILLFFYLLNVSFIVSFVSKLSFIFPFNFVDCYSSFYFFIFMDFIFSMHISFI